MKPEIKQEMIRYFKDRGFDSPLFSGEGATQEVWMNGKTGVNVVLNFENETATLKTIDGKVTSILGPFAVPNKHISIFLKQIERHTENNS